MEREVGAGIGMGNTCKPMAVSFQCMTKFTTNKKTNKWENLLNDEKKKKEYLSPKFVLSLSPWNPARLVPQPHQQLRMDT